MENPFSSSSSSRPQQLLMYKNRLQEFTQRSSIPLPVYQTFNEGSVHAPKFKSTVFVDGKSFVSEETFPQKKTAEQDVAKCALQYITDMVFCKSILNEFAVYCKSILNEFAVKMNLEMPTYNTLPSEGLFPLFTSSLVFNGVTYYGETGRKKKDAEQLAARAVILSLLDDPMYGTFLSEIIKSKAKLLDEEVPEYVDLPSACVPPVVEQASDVGENSLRKRRRKNRRAEHGDTDNQ